MANEGYLDRHYRAYVELNLRRAYKEHGMYRVQFPTIVARRDGSAIAVTTAIEEGPKYSLGTVELAGEGLPNQGDAGRGEL